MVVVHIPSALNDPCVSKHLSINDISDHPHNLIFLVHARAMRCSGPLQRLGVVLGIQVSGRGVIQQSKVIRQLVAVRRPHDHRLRCGS